MTTAPELAKRDTEQHDREELVKRLRDALVDLTGGMKSLKIDHIVAGSYKRACEAIVAYDEAADLLPSPTPDGFNISSELVSEIVAFIKEWGDRGIGYHNHARPFALIQKLEKATGKRIVGHAPEL